MFSRGIIIKTSQKIKIPTVQQILSHEQKSYNLEQSVKRLK